MASLLTSSSSLKLDHVNSIYKQTITLRSSVSKKTHKNNLISLLVLQKSLRISEEILCVKPNLHASWRCQETNQWQISTLTLYDFINRSRNRGSSVLKCLLCRADREEQLCCLFSPCLLIATLQCGILFIHSYAETSSWFLPLSTNILFWGPKFVRVSESICQSKQIHSFKHPLGCQTNCVGSSLFPTFDRGTT